MTPNELLGWRTRRGLSQSALARKLGVAPATVHRWEKPDGEHPIPRWLPLALRALEQERADPAERETER